MLRGRSGTERVCEVSGIQIQHTLREFVSHAEANLGGTFTFGGLRLRRLGGAQSVELEMKPKVVRKPPEGTRSVKLRMKFVVGEKVGGTPNLECGMKPEGAQDVECGMELQVVRKLMHALLRPCLPVALS